MRLSDLKGRSPLPLNPWNASRNATRSFDSQTKSAGSRSEKGKEIQTWTMPEPALSGVLIGNLIPRGRSGGEHLVANVCELGIGLTDDADPEMITSLEPPPARNRQ